MKKSIYSFIVILVIVLSTAVGSTLAFKTIGGTEQTPIAIQNEVRTFLLPESEEKEPTPIPTPEVGLPIQISIPAIQAHANIEYVGLDAQRRMDVPKNEWNVAWYELGPKPGEKGNAAIAGHLDSKTGPAIFYDLEKLVVGDEITVSATDGHTYTFQVTEVARYDVNEFPLEEVFGKHDKARLNLITCEGTFNSSTQNYSHRVVVYSELIEA